MERDKKGSGKKWARSLFHLATWLFLASCLVFFLPNAAKIRRYLSGETRLQLTKEEIHVVDLGTANQETGGGTKQGAGAVKKTYGNYCLLGDFPATELELKLKWPAYSEEETAVDPFTCKVYYLEEEGQEYSEENSLELELRKEGTWHMSLPREVAALRIDLPCRVIQVKAQMAPFHWYWLNLLVLYFLMITFRLYRRWMGKGSGMNREMLVSLARNDLRSRYAGSALGVTWAFAQPLLTILVMWYVFQIGFRNPPVRRWAFIPWFVTGYIPWMFFSDTLLSMAVSMREYSYLVKKVRFPLQILPGVKFLASLTIHGFFLVFTFFLLQLYGFRPTLHWLPLLYYTFCLGCLIYALGMLFAALSVLFSDFSNLLGVLLQVLFWYTPIFWDYASLQKKVLWIFKANPMFYVVKGYRDSFLGAGTFAGDPAGAILFWSVTCALLILGSRVFARTRPHFADLL